MKAELLTIGDEILIGQIVNTNAVFLSKVLNKIGIEIIQITSLISLMQLPQRSLSDYFRYLHPMYIL